MKTHSTHYTTCWETAWQLCCQREECYSSATLLNDRHFLLLTSYVYCVWMGSEKATATWFFPESVQGVAGSARQLVSMFPKFPSIWVVVMGGVSEYRTGWSQSETKRVFAPRVAGDRYQMTGTGNKSCGRTCDHSQAQMANRPPGREATLLAQQVTLNDQKPFCKYMLILNRMTATTNPNPVGECSNKKKKKKGTQVHS